MAVDDHAAFRALFVIAEIRLQPEPSQMPSNPREALPWTRRHMRLAVVGVPGSLLMPGAVSGARAALAVTRNPGEP